MTNAQAKANFNRLTDNDKKDIILKMLLSEVINHDPVDAAKLTDTRAPDYIARFGEQSWELDALDPRVIDELISNEIKKYIDKDKWEIIKQRENATRLKLAKMAKQWKDGLD